MLLDTLGLAINCFSYKASVTNRHKSVGDASFAGTPTGSRGSFFTGEVGPKTGGKGGSKGGFFTGEVGPITGGKGGGKGGFFTGEVGAKGRC